MLQIVLTTNLLLRLAVEFAALAALAYWGFRVFASTSLRTVVSIVAPLTAAVLWATLASPHASIALPGVAKTAVQAVILGSAAAALIHTGKPRLAGTFGAIALVNAVLLVVWDQ
jgi:hypothetical protein